MQNDSSSTNSLNDESTKQKGPAIDSVEYLVDWMTSYIYNDAHWYCNNWDALSNEGDNKILRIYDYFDQYANTKIGPNYDNNKFPKFKPICSTMIRDLTIDLKKQHTFEIVKRKSTKDVRASVEASIHRYRNEYGKPSSGIAEYFQVPWWGRAIICFQMGYDFSSRWEFVLRPHYTDEEALGKFVGTMLPAFTASLECEMESMFFLRFKAIEEIRKN